MFSRVRFAVVLLALVTTAATAENRCPRSGIVFPERAGWVVQDDGTDFRLVYPRQLALGGIRLEVYGPAAVRESAVGELQRLIQGRLRKAHSPGRLKRQGAVLHKLEVSAPETGTLGAFPVRFVRYTVSLGYPQKKNASRQEGTVYLLEQRGRLWLLDSWQRSFPWSANQTARVRKDLEALLRIRG